MDRSALRRHGRRASISLVALLAACASLLPDSNKDSKTPWKSYAEAASTFAHITPGTTTLVELKALGYDPDRTPNVAVLSYSDVLRRLQALIAFEGKGLDPALKKCVSSRQDCYAFRVEQQVTERERVGNFWLDFLNFKRVTNIKGWQFDAMILISNGKVVYKCWSGTPNIQTTEQERRPLGPLQGVGSQIP